MLLSSNLAQIVSIMFMKKSAKLFSSSSCESAVVNGFSFLPLIKPFRILNRFLEFVVLVFICSTMYFLLDLKMYLL